MKDPIWEFVDAAGAWTSQSWGTPRMTGRVLAWLLVCDPPEQTAAEIAEAVGASKGAVSGATGSLVRLGMLERLHVRGERAARFRFRDEAWEEQSFDQRAVDAGRAVMAKGLAALEGASAARRARLEEIDAFYAWWQVRSPQLYDEWREYRDGGGEAK